MTGNKNPVHGRKLCSPSTGNFQYTKMENRHLKQCAPSEKATDQSQILDLGSHNSLLQHACAKFCSPKVTPPYPIVMNKISLVEPLPPLLTWNSTSVSWLLETKLTQLKDPLLEQENCFRVWINYFLYFIESCKVINIDVFFHELISKKCPVCLGSAGRLDPAGAHLQVPAQHATHLH